MTTERDDAAKKFSKGWTDELQHCANESYQAGWDAHQEEENACCDLLNRYIEKCKLLESKRDFYREWAEKLSIELGAERGGTTQHWMEFEAAKKERGL
jgi:hypothetical protein